MASGWRSGARNGDGGGGGIDEAPGEGRGGAAVLAMTAFRFGDLTTPGKTYVDCTKSLVSARASSRRGALLRSAVSSQCCRHHRAVGCEAADVCTGSSDQVDAALGLRVVDAVAVAETAGAAGVVEPRLDVGGEPGCECADDKEEDRSGDGDGGSSGGEKSGACSGEVRRRRCCCAGRDCCGVSSQEGAADVAANTEASRGAEQTSEMTAEEPAELAVEARAVDVARRDASLAGRRRVSNAAAVAAAGTATGGGGRGAAVGTAPATAPSMAGVSAAAGAEVGAAAVTAESPDAGRGDEKLSGRLVGGNGEVASRSVKARTDELSSRADSTMSAYRSRSTAPDAAVVPDASEAALRTARCMRSSATRSAPAASAYSPPSTFTPNRTGKARVDGLPLRWGDRAGDAHASRGGVARVGLVDDVWLVYASYRGTRGGESRGCGWRCGACHLRVPAAVAAAGAVCGFVGRGDASLVGGGGENDAAATGRRVSAARNRLPSCCACAADAVGKGCLGALSGT